MVIYGRFGLKSLANNMLEISYAISGKSFRHSVSALYLQGSLDGSRLLRIHRLILFSISVHLLVVAPVRSQRSTATQQVTTAKRLAPSESTSKKTQHMSCWDNTKSFTGSHLVRSPILASADGLHRAYVEVEAIGFEPQDTRTYIGPLCENTSRLFVAGPHDQTFRLIYLYSPELSGGNSMELVDWSPDGTHLLVEVSQWTYESEAEYTDFLVFNWNSGTVAKPDLSQILASRFENDCGSENRATGFTPEGWVVVAVNPLVDGIAIMNGAKSCVARRVLLALDLERGPAITTQTLSDSFKVRHFGTFSESHAAK